MLTSKQRAEFRAQANSLETTLMVGKDGVTEAVVAEADKLLTARELVKGKVLETALMSAREASDAICEATGADQVRHLAVQRKMSGRAQPDRPRQTQGDPQVQGRPGGKGRPRPPPGCPSGAGAAQPVFPGAGHRKVH